MHDKRMNEHSINKTKRCVEKHKILNGYTWCFRGCSKNLIKFHVLVTHYSRFIYSCVCRTKYVVHIDKNKCNCQGKSISNNYTFMVLN